MSLLGALAVALVLVGAGVAIGIVARNVLAYEPHRNQREAKVRADMDALMRAQQLNTAFLTARQALWEEARRHQMPEAR